MPLLRSLARKVLPAVLLLAAAPYLPGPASGGAGFAEYQVKAEFLGRIAQFVDWPEEAFGGPEEPFVIAVEGQDPFGKYLDEMARLNSVKGRRILVRRLRHGDPVLPCHILFIARSEYSRLDEILGLTAGRPVLTVGDGEKFARLGADMGLYREAGHVRFNINLAPSRRNRLVISSMLLRLATAVYGERGS